MWKIFVVYTFLYSVTWDGNQIVLCTEIPVIIKYVNKFEIQNKRRKKKLRELVEVSALRKLISFQNL